MVIKRERKYLQKNRKEMDKQNIEYRKRNKGFTNSNKCEGILSQKNDIFGKQLIVISVKVQYPRRMIFSENN